MRLLIDECIAGKVKRLLPGHDVWTVREMGWLGKKNGELLKAMVANSFEVLVTVDKGFKHQQNIQSSGIAVVLLRPKKNRVVELVPLMPAVLTALGSIK